jgi:hypothetical protein
MGLYVDKHVCNPCDRLANVRANVCCDLVWRFSDRDVRIDFAVVFQASFSREA